MDELKLGGLQTLDPRIIEATDGLILIEVIERLMRELKEKVRREGARIDWGTVRIEVGPSMVPAYGWAEVDAHMTARTVRETDDGIVEGLRAVALMLHERDKARGRRPL